MSSFSSVVQKPGKKIVPKAAPRRNVQRKTQPEPAPIATSSIPVVSEARDQEQDETNSAEIPVVASANQADVEQAESASEPEAQRSQPSIEQTANDPDENTTAQLNATEVEVVTAPLENAEEPRSETVVLQNDKSGVAAGSVEQPTITSIETTAENTQDAPSAAVEEPATDSVTTSAALEIPAAPNLQKTNPDAPATRSKRQRGTTEANKGPESNRKRRKTVPHATPESTAVQTPTSPDILTRQSPAPEIRPATNVVGADPPVDDDADDDDDDLFQSATRRAATVSELANSIESQTRSLRPRRGFNADDETNVNPETRNSTSTPKLGTKSTRNRRKKTVDEQAAEIVANAMGISKRSGNQRDVTPENAEDYELEPTKVTMGQLCEDRKLGKKSTLETEMEAHWPEILQRRREDRERARANAEKRSRKVAGQANSSILNQEPVAALAPVMTVVNGVIVVDQGSREIDRAAQLQQAAGQDLSDVREDLDYYKYVNQNTVGMKSGQGRGASWDEESTERFHKGLRMFGTDFLMIANMFPGVSRKQIKAKFIREENANKSKVLESLRKRETVELDEYAAMTNKESEGFQTLESLQKELDEQEAKLRDEDNERRKREGFAAADKDTNGQQSTSEGMTETADGQTASAESGRFDAAAREIIDAAMGPKKKGRKTNTANSKRGAKGGRRIEGGVEEVLGSIEDFGR